MDTVLSDYARSFQELDRYWRKLLADTPEQLLFRRMDDLGSPAEHLVRSAACVEQAFGGITTRLWDDPFEWTLPEELSDRAGISNYLDEVAETRKRGLAFIRSDVDLRREIPAPVRLKTLDEILKNCLSDAKHHLERAEALRKKLSDPRAGARA